MGWLGVAVDGLAPLGCLGLTKEAGKEPLVHMKHLHLIWHLDH